MEKKDSKFCSVPCFQQHQKAISKNAPLLANSLLQGINQAVESDIFSTPKNSSPKAVNKSKRQLSADSSQDDIMLMSGPKKVGYEKFSSFTDGLDLSQLDSLSKDEITSKLHAVLDFAKTQTERISKLEAELVDVKLAFADSMTLLYINQRSVPMAKLPSPDPALPLVPAFSEFLVPVVFPVFKPFLLREKRVPPTLVIIRRLGFQSPFFTQIKTSSDFFLFLFLSSVGKI